MLGNDHLSQLLAQYQAQQQAYGKPQMPQVPGLLADEPKPGQKVEAFDPTAYLQGNADVQRAWDAGNPWGRGFSTPNDWATAHYNEAGKREGRAFPTMMVDAGSAQAQQARGPQPPTPPVRPYQGDFNTYGMGGEHLWFGGLNGQPYGLTSFTGFKPQQSITNDQFQQLLAAISASRGGSNAFLNFAGGAGDSGHGDGTSSGPGDGFGGVNGDAGIGGDTGTGFA